MSDIGLGPFPPWLTLIMAFVINTPYGLGMLVVVAVISLLPAMLIVLIAAPPVITSLRRASAKQIAYEDAPQTHQVKTGTPTMGGILFGVVPIVALLVVPRRETVALAALVLSCMAIGAVDDVAKIRGQKNKGLRAIPKFALTALAAIVFLVIAGPHPASLVFVGAVPVWLWYGLSVCVVLATTHAVNLTDGLDGLASGAIVPPLVTISYSALANATFGVAMFAMATAGAALGFLFYNRYPARVFMGDTGSLALGGALAGVAILSNAHLLLLLAGGVFVAETLSVIVQVASYKTTRRRVFRMSPLHHHFELGGWPETKVTRRFWLASLALSLLGFALIAQPT